jgi:hypothetical protein
MGAATWCRRRRCDRTWSAPVLALSVSHSLENAMQRWRTACLVFPVSSRRGFIPVIGEMGVAEIFFFAEPTLLVEFWRSIFAFENVSEKEFFQLGRLAFPRLVLHPDLNFRRLEGSYRDLRERVVEVLAGLCDHFAREYRQCQGMPHVIQASMGRYHVELSPESPSTRRSDKLMQQRRKHYGGHEFLCEWHAKLESHRNRIHFAVPADELDGKLLIGIFVHHLDT